MHRCFANPDDWEGSEIRLSPAEEHHILDVLRVGDGQTVIVFDGRGREALARVDVCSPGAGDVQRIRLAVLSCAEQGKPDVAITLVQALPKGKRMDLIVEKATELGVLSILPVVSEHVVGRPGERQAAEKVARWRRIAVSAAKQCAAAWVPQVKAIVDYPAGIDAATGSDLFLVGSLAEGAKPLHSVLSGLDRGSIRNALVLIGPEGDLTAKEISRATDAGAIAVSFGPLVLRVETAALYALSILTYELRG